MLIVLLQIRHGGIVMEYDEVELELDDDDVVQDNVSVVVIHDVEHVVEHVVEVTFEVNTALVYPPLHNIIKRRKRAPGHANRFR